LTIAALAAVSAFAQSSSGNSNLNLTIGPEAAFTALLSTTSLTTAAGGLFGAYTGTTTFTYKIRTTESTGSGVITVQVTDFASGGPLISDLTFNCTAASGTACSSGTAASDSAGVTVVSFAGGVHSADGGDAGTVAWSLVNRPSTKTGSYSSTATFNISAL
jgi:hypothetical protein